MDGRFGRFGKLGRLGIVNDGMDMDGMETRGMCCEMDGRPTDGKYSEMLDVEFRRNSVFSAGSDGKPHDDEQSTSASPVFPFPAPISLTPVSYGLNSELATGSVGTRRIRMFDGCCSSGPAAVIRTCCCCCCCMNAECDRIRCGCDS